MIVHKEIHQRSGTIPKGMNVGPPVVYYNTKTCFVPGKVTNLYFPFPLSHVNSLSTNQQAALCFQLRVLVPQLNGGKSTYSMDFLHISCTSTY